MFVILNKSKEQVEYLGIDYSSGGYPYWSGILSSAKIYKSYEDAIKELNSYDFRKNSTTSSGKEYPPRMIHSALDLSFEKMEGEGSIVIAEIKLEEIRTFGISGKLPS